MNEIILSYENNNLQYVCYEYTRHGIIEKNINYKNLKEYLNYLNENRQLLSPIRIEGNDLIFSTDKFIIKLLDYKDFKKRKRFSFIFDKLRKDKFKLYKVKFTKPIAIALAIITSIGVGSILVEGIEDLVADEEISSEFNENETVDELDFTLPEEITVENTTIEEVLEETTVVKNNEEYVESENNNEIYDNLCIGNACDDEKAIKTRELYYPLFEKYAEKYGLDTDLICAIATQERGVHSSTIDDGGAIGIMQVQVGVWNNETIYAYDYLNNKQNVVHITLEDLRDVEKNIEIGCMIFQSYLNQMNGNVIAALQSYNNGTGTVNGTISTYCYSCGKTKNEVLEENDLGWLDYRASSNPGDEHYVEHVLRYYQGNVNNLINNGIRM